MMSQDEYAFDMRGIFIAREQQLDLFHFYLTRWQERIANISGEDAPVVTAPSPDARIQGLVVLIYGRGGIGKSTLLRRYRESVLQASDIPQGRRIVASTLIDWESASEGKRGLFASGKGVDAAGYFRLLCAQLAIALGKSMDDFKHYQRAGRDVGAARKQAERVIETLRGDDRFAGLRWAAGEGLIGLLRLVPYVGAPLRNEQIAEKTKELLGEGAALTAEQLVRLHTRLHNTLGRKLEDYLEPDLKLGLAIGSDLRDFARNSPLLIFFDTYEAIDEGDRLLRIVMGAAGRRVGWLIAGRDNLWGGVDQQRRSLGIEYGYKEIVPPDRSLEIDFSKSATGSFTRSDIKTYFDELCRRVLSDPPLAPITDEQAAEVETVTRGIPLAVRVAAAIYLKTRDVAALTGQEQSQRDIVEQMVYRYLLHVRDDEQDRAKLYGLALLPRADQPAAIVAALNLSPDEAEARYNEELARLHRRYSFVFTEAEEPALHDEVRHFLRLWLRERRAQPNITAINDRLKAAHVQSLHRLEERQLYSTLKDRLQDDEWSTIYLDLTEQQCWLDPVEGVRLLLPFMLAAAIYRRDANEDAVTIGNFFAHALSSPYRHWWTYASDSLKYLHSHIPSPGELHSLEELHKLMQQRRSLFVPPLSAYRDELEAALCWRLGEAYSGSDDHKALDWYDKALLRLGDEDELREAAAQVCTYIAYDLVEAKKYTECLMLLDKAITLKPDATAYYSRGIVYTEQKEYERAIADYSEALRLDPSDATAYYSRGIAYAEQKEYERAIADYSEALRLDPTLAAAYYNRGFAYLLLRKSVQAKADYEHGFELDPTDSNAAWMAEWAGMGKLRPGKEMAMRLVEIAAINAEHYVAYVCRGVALGLRGRLKEGLEEMEQAISLEPERWDPYFWQGMLRAYHYWGQMHDRETMAAIEKALELDMPPVLLRPLYWLEEERPDFFKRCAKPQLEQMGV